MHYITLDTNTWIYLANGTEPVRLLRFIKEEVEKNNITVLLPEIIIDEWDKNKDNAVKQGVIKHFKEINEALSRISKLIGDESDKDIFKFLLDEPKNKDYFEDFFTKFKAGKDEIELAIANNIKLIDDLFKYKTTKIIKVKNELYLKAGQYALSKKAPFKTKNSFADALIVFSFIDYVLKEKINNAIFISYNTEDFCIKKDNKKLLHPDLESDFQTSKSKFYITVGEALNTIKKDIVSKEEIEFIKELQEEAQKQYHTEYCTVCDGENGSNEIFFGKPQILYDERVKPIVINDKQTELEFAKGMPKTLPKLQYTEIEVGQCNWCNSEHFICVDCETLNHVLDHEYNKRKECEGCELPYYIALDVHNDDIHEGVYSILNDFEICEKCGKEFEDDGNHNVFCEDCESEYSYGIKS